MDCKELDQRYRERLNEIVYPLIFISIVIGVASFAAGAWSAGEQNQRLQRLERINGIDEIGRRK
jgi:hypothetical protein